MANITTLDLGVITPIPKGEYNPATDYERLNFVTFNGSSWIRTDKEPYVVGSIPQTGSLYWQLNASGVSEIPDASLTVKGITKLSNATNSVDETVAATSRAVKTVNDKWSAIGTAAMRDVGTEPNEIPTNSVLGSVTEALGQVTESLGQVTESLGEVQVQGTATWSADGTPYPINAQVYHNGKQWLALRANSVEPSEGEDWTELVGKQYVDASLPDLTSYLQPSMTGSATLNGTTDNTVQLTDIVTTLGLEVGDVIRIQYSGYNKLHTVESITNDDLIVVNYEHAGNRGNGSLRLPDTTATVTITRIAKWYNAPIGFGQEWVDVKARRAKAVTYTNTTDRSIVIFLQKGGGDYTAKLTIGALTVTYGENGNVIGQIGTISMEIPSSVTYSSNDFGIWWELR